MKDNLTDSSTIVIAPLREIDRQSWNVLASSYKAFYETELPDSKYDEVWIRLLNADGVHGLGAYLQGKLVGITHYLFHSTFWDNDLSCYLQDLYVEETARGHGVARALIEAVARSARERNASKLYWQTRHNNITARALYDKIASHNGFIRYDYKLD
ncbi:GNAT family acetyltransferase [Paenibacillus ferrarius]|uniref:GNAT family acetyltransferase n=1 Tax=Paenibacillus ferrarius TaxID=1469647 RepID=A0A1V4HL44_9BACL|nr:GNAT family N-acetyltransferase [Paenibacillus ferrarius]OPH57858.1 GNAT family acetyltransferase [Paenibacillus ferrarius]